MNRIIYTDDSYIYLRSEEIEKNTTKIKLTIENKVVYIGPVLTKVKLENSVENGSIIKVYISKNEIWLPICKEVYIKKEKIEFDRIDKYTDEFKIRLKELLSEKNRKRIN